MGFKVPECVETDAWGPPVDSVDADRALTYAPFTRSDKFGRGETLRPPVCLIFATRTAPRNTRAIARFPRFDAPN